ncbi:MAG TPA: MFS transporter [Gemmatimonadaceae bacterium]|jgi:MFS family permease
MTNSSGAGERILLVSSSIGSIVEWYDFFVFASAAALVFDRVFFPAVDPWSGVLLALMTYALGFATRPLGGLVFGVLGDRFGRKRALVWSLLLMGVATMGVGLVPSYAAIGLLAPILLVLLRLIQGFAVGGEVGGALLLVAESLPAPRRGYWTAWPMIGGPAGNVLSSIVLALLGLSLGRLPSPRGAGEPPSSPPACSSASASGCERVLPSPRCIGPTPSVAHAQRHLRPGRRSSRTGDRC